ncbi:unnamed protein product [Adineta ricciae]|uniref:E3 ubiquitin ligase complex SCF subunit n=1 Tax=Adineta ricciae TaxID=249248 RepID=A0A814N976_ADIRI|nr:unnamed protein product [Adineta ricciae]CAF1373772.1 unnamed protein product [Adineta ricciae]
MALKVVSKDGVEFQIDAEIAQQSSLLKPYSDEGFSGSIPLINVESSILKYIIEFCNHHKNDSQSEAVDGDDDDDDDDPNKDIYEPKRRDDIGGWDSNFMKQFSVQYGTLFDIIMASNYLGIKLLLSAGCKAVSNLVKGKSAQEIREIFHISYDPPHEGENVISNGLTDPSASNDTGVSNDNI